MPRVMLSFQGSKYIHLRILLPSERGLASVLTALKGALMVEDDETYKSEPSVTVGDEVSVEIKQLRREVRFKVRVDGVTYDVPEPGKAKPALNGHKKTPALREPDNQLGLRLGRGGA